MSSRDWSEAYFSDEGSVHGRAAIDGCASGITTEKKVCPFAVAMVETEKAYKDTCKVRDDAMKSFMGDTIEISEDAQGTIYDYDIQYDGRRAYPKWVSDEIRKVKQHNEKVENDAIDAFMDSDIAEGIIDNIVIAKSNYDAACKAFDDMKKQQNNKVNEYYDIVKKGWVVALNRNQTIKGCYKWKNAIDSVVPNMSIALTQIMKVINHPTDSFIPDRIVMLKTVQDEINFIGFGSDWNQVVKYCDTNGIDIVYFDDTEIV